jgi:hypothetical protein
MSYVVRLPNNSYKPITNTAWVCARLCKLQKREHSTHSRPGTLASSTTKTGRHDIAEIMLKVALNTIKIKSNIFMTLYVEEYLRSPTDCRAHRRWS